MYQRVARNIELQGGLPGIVTLPTWFPFISWAMLLILIVVLVSLAFYSSWLLSLGLGLASILTTTFLPLPEKHFLKKIQNNIIRRKAESLFEPDR